MARRRVRRLGNEEEPRQGGAQSKVEGPLPFESSLEVVSLDLS